MDATVLLQSLLGSGPMGVVAWLLFQQLKSDRSELIEILRAKMDADAKLAAALTVLALKITGQPPEDDRG